MKKFTNNKWIWLFALSMVSALSAYAQENVIDEVVWVVGDEAILKSEVEEARLNAQYEGRKFDGDPYCIIPEELAIQKLYMHQAELDSITVSEGDILPRVDAIENQYIASIGSKEKMEEYFNKTYSQIREQLRENIRVGATVQKMQQKIVGDIKVTPAEVRQYYKTLPKDSIPFIPTMVEVQILTLQPKVPESEIEDIKRRLREYTERVEKGETSFSTLALLYSEDKNSAAKGGEIGFFGKGQLDPEYANVAFNLTDPAKVSKIVRSEYGYHIIQLIEKRGDRINTRHILLRPRVPDSAITAAQAHLDSIGNDIRDKKFTFDLAAQELSADKDTRNNYGLMVNQNDNTAKFQMEELPQEVAKMVDKMTVGEVSKSFTMVNKDGNEVCAIVKLKSRNNGHKANITDDYQNVKELMLNKKREEILNQWIAEKQKRTYIRINPNWQKCNFKYPGWIKKN
jgi:peptidyl-prolyl cis-trans isomerase SurA